MYTLNTRAFPQTHAVSGEILRCRTWHPTPEERETCQQREQRAVGTQAPLALGKHAGSPRHHQKSSHHTLGTCGAPGTVHTGLHSKRQGRLLYPFYRKENGSSERRRNSSKVAQQVRGRDRTQAWVWGQSHSPSPITGLCRTGLSQENRTIPPSQARPVPSPPPEPMVRDLGFQGKI